MAEAWTVLGTVAQSAPATDVDVFEEAPVGMALTDAAGRFRSVNAAFGRLLGRRPADLVGTPIASLSRRDDVAGAQAVMNDLLGRVAETARFEDRYLRPDGSVVWVDMSIRSLTGPGGAVSGFLAQGLDITARKQAELAADRRRHQLEEAQRTAGLGSFEHDPQTGLFSASHELCRILGLSAGAGTDVAGLVRLVHPEDRRLLEEASGRCLAERVPLDVVHRLVLADGTRRWAHVRAHWAADEVDGRDRVVGTVLDVTALKQAEQDLEHQALHDVLTGLPNRVLVTDRLRQSLARSRRAHTPVAVIVLGLDRLGDINDSLGHEAGDAILAELARRLEVAVGPGDTVGRFVGDKFAVICEGATAGQAQDIARRLVEECARPLCLAGRELRLGTSAGFTVAGWDGSAESALHDADTAMYRAQAGGGPRVEAFDVSLRHRASNQLRMEAALRGAVEHGEMAVLYQPIMDMASAQVVGAEALLRWASPELGAVSPAVFVPLAERLGIINDLGDWALRRVCQDLPAIEAAAGRVPVSVNLSAHQLSDTGFADRALRALAESGTDPHLLLVEVTETALMSDTDAALAALTSLRQLGVRVALDDFGTGYSSLAYLKKFPIDVVKIDRYFVSALGHDANDTLIVAAIINLAHTLGLTVVADGVEDVTQIQELRRLDCRYGQGFVWSRAVRAVELGRRRARSAGAARKAGWAASAAFEPVAFPRAVLDSLPCSTAVVDRTGTVVATNLEWKRLAVGSGARAQATTGIGANYLTACDRAQGDGAGPGRAAAAGIRSVLAGTTSSFELDYPGGTPSRPRWFTMRVAPLPLASGAAVVMHLDVTERHLAESALRLSEARANATFEHAPIGICWLDHAGVVVEVNPALTAIIGRPADQIVGKYPTVFWNCDDAAGTGADFGRLLRGELNSYARERRLVRSDGSVRNLYVAVSVVRPPDDVGPPMAIATVEDVTELRRLADELHRAQELEALGRLAGGIAHEINTPIQFIGDNLRFLADVLPELIGPPSGLVPAEALGTSPDGFEMSIEIPAAIAQSLEGVARVAAIVGAMKAFGQRDGTRPALADLNEALRTTLVIAGHEFKYVADIEVELGDIPAVPCYVGELSQVFLNLVVNGAQAIAERVSGTAERGRITARTWAGDGSAYISISDTGTGIPAAVAEHMYEPFFTTKALGKGTGQGLSVARATIVNRHGGTIDFTTKAGEGTTFTIRIPTTWAGE